MNLSILFSLLISTDSRFLFYWYSFCSTFSAIYSKQNYILLLFSTNSSLFNQPCIFIGIPRFLVFSNKLNFIKIFVIITSYLWLINWRVSSKSLLKNLNNLPFSSKKEMFSIFFSTPKPMPSLDLLSETFNNNSIRFKHMMDLLLLSQLLSPNSLVEDLISK